MADVQLAIGCRQMLKEKKYGLPEVSLELVGDFYTILIGFTMEAAEADPYDPQGDQLAVCKLALPCVSAFTSAVAC